MSDYSKFKQRSCKIGKKRLYKRKSETRKQFWCRCIEYVFTAILGAAKFKG